MRCPAVQPLSEAYVVLLVAVQWIDGESWNSPVQMIELTPAAPVAVNGTKSSAQALEVRVNGVLESSLMVPVSPGARRHGRST